ncbi:integrase catalytic domain-containing protein [Trichonephila clavipes]|nr:integrase catalytic domain-containing protein [Trichonephila clavipes]
MQFCPINGKGIARKTVHDCIACFRQKPTGVDQLMGNLPSERVTPSAPFLNSGVDFCGPFQIKFKNQRKGIFSKVYVAIFVCLATKAIHLEAVTDLTTEAFIAALKRLCARRGRISTLMSDNATNFKGAAAELNRFIKLICNKNETLANYFASEAIQWKFIPPRSPNFGGLWEAGVKSLKHHLYRTLVNSKITFEEFETIIIQIEGILNSRPLVPLSDNINEYEVLTLGHFIIGRPISAIPEPAILDISDNRLSRWQYTTKCVQTIWKRWKNDYLNHLQQRNKWQFEKNNVAVGCLVLLKENDLPPCKWTMARILEVIYGTDEPLIFELPPPQLNTTWSTFTNKLANPDNFHLPIANFTHEIDSQVSNFTNEILNAHISASKSINHLDQDRGKLKNLFKERNKGRKIWQYIRYPQHKPS